MGGVSKTFALAVTAVSVATTLAILFAWVGPGLSGVASPASAAVLFDEKQVQQIYDHVSPAVVEVITDDQNGNGFLPTGFGSGFLIDKEGHIVTNNHVAEAADRVRVRFLQGPTAQASVLGRNPANDLALLKVDPAIVADIEPVELGDSSLVRPGQLAIAIGSPFQMEGTVTAGIISGVDRSLPSDLGRSISGVIQTDALIGPGNSGGPLLNSAGQVVGINTAMEVPFYGVAAPSFRGSAGFAVPSNSLAQVLPRLKAQQVVRPPWLGISAANVDELLAEQLGLSVDRGVYVTGVAADSPAQEAGIVPSRVNPFQEGGIESTEELGDVIIAVSGTPVQSANDLIAELDRYQPGAEITLTVLRQGSETELSVTLGEWPERQNFGGAPRFYHPDPPDLPRDHYRSPFPGLPFPDLIPEFPQR